MLWRLYLRGRELIKVGLSLSGDCQLILITRDERRIDRIQRVIQSLLDEGWSIPLIKAYVQAYEEY